MRSVVLYILLLMPLLTTGKDMKRYYENDSYKVDYYSNNGKLNGKYVSHYRNGQVKAEGKFENNQRIGIWSVYDTTGKLVMSRDYKNSFVYERIFPAKEKTGPASLFDTAIYSLDYKSEGYIDYFPLKERMVLYSSRIWRSIYAGDNPILFENDLLYSTLYNHVTDSTKESYCSFDEGFNQKMKGSELEKFSPDEYSIHSFKIMEDSFYDNERCISETRIIGICPVGIHKKTKDTTDLFWAYYPYVRKSLAGVKMDKKTFPESIKTLDDIFFFRYFFGEIDKESNVFDKTVKESVRIPDLYNSERQRIEIGLLETEHDIWLGILPRS